MTAAETVRDLGVTLDPQLSRQGSRNLRCSDIFFEVSESKAHIIIQ